MVVKGNVNDDIVMINLEVATKTPKKTKEIQVVSEDNQLENSNEPVEMEAIIDIHQVYDDVLYVPEEVPERVAEKKNEALPKVGKGRPFPRHLYTELSCKRVDKIPTDIDGMVWYQVKTSQERWHKDTADLHYFEMKTSNKIGMDGITKNGRCKGSWVCTNQKSSSRSTSHENQPNKVNMKTDPNNCEYKICEIWEHYTEQEGCDTRKVNP